MVSRQTHMKICAFVKFYHEIPVVRGENFKKTFELPPPRFHFKLFWGPKKWQQATVPVGWTRPGVGCRCKKEVVRVLVATYPASPRPRTKFFKSWTRSLVLRVFLTYPKRKFDIGVCPDVPGIFNEMLASDIELVLTDASYQT